MSLCFGAGTGESWVLKINSFSPVHSKEPASSTDKFEQLTEGLSSSWWLWFYHSNPLLLLSPILLLLSWLPFKDQHAGSLIWKLINFSLCHVSSLVGDQGLISLRNVLFYVVSAQRESQVKAFLRLNTEPAPPCAESWEGVVEESLFSPQHFWWKAYKLSSRCSISSWKSRGMFPYLVWTGLFHLPQFLTSVRRGHNNYSTSWGTYNKVAMEVTMVWRHPRGFEGLGAAGRWEVTVGIMCLAGVCGIALIFIFWWDQSQLPTDEVTAFLFWPPDCTYFLWTIF